MRSNHPLRPRAFSVVAAAFLLAAAGLGGSAIAQPGLPTFQGSLASSGLPATGTYDIRFSLFAAGTGGPALQSGIVSDVAVSNGLFSATLPFDPSLYAAGSPRWLGIEVRTAGSTTFTALTPRLALSPAPSALSMPGISRDASETLDQNIAEGATAVVATLSTARWQSFTCTATGLLRSCTVQLANTGTSNRTITANLYAGEGNSTTPIATTTFVLPASTPSREFNFSFTGAPRVAPGDVLTLSLVTNSSSAVWATAATDVYAGGRSSLSATQDFNLKTFIEVDGATPGYIFAGDVSAARLSAASAELGVYQGGTATSVVEGFNKQLVLSGPFDTGFNAGNSVKLLIADYNNDTGANIYPIYVEDENNVVDFFLRKVGSSTAGAATAYFGGNVGIGTLTPALPLEVNGKIRVQGAIQNAAAAVTTGDMGLYSSTSDAWLRLVTNNGPIQFFTDYTDGAGTSAGGPAMTLSAAGNLGLGVPAPTTKLDLSSPSVAAGAWQVLIRNESTANRGGIRMTNDGFIDISNTAQNGVGAFAARLNSLGAWSTTSDARTKSDIAAVPSGQLLDAALKLRPVTFYFNAEKLNGQLPPQPHLGLIAQEVQQVVPDLVTQGEGLLTMNYAGLSVVALGAVQEQQRLISELRLRADTLQGEVQALRDEKDALKRELLELSRRLNRLEAGTNAKLTR